MEENDGPAHASAVIARLRKFADAPPPVERCELCGNELAAEHPHLIHLASHRLVCSCQACGILFDSADSAHYRRLSHRRQRLTDFQLSDDQWAALQLPVSLAFICEQGSPKQVIAQYPSPAGTIQSTVDADLWRALVAQNSALAEMRPEVEALLVNRVKSAREFFIVPIDDCYRLVGTIRRQWQGFMGGDLVRDSIEQFFVELDSSATRHGAAHG